MLTKSIFFIDNSPIFCGYTAGTHWNGWACPSFTKETCEEICDWINSVCVGIQYAYYDTEQDAFIVTDINCIEAENPDGIEEKAIGVNVTTEDGERHLYSLGAWNWIWDDASEVFSAEAFVEFYLKNHTGFNIEECDAAYEDITHRCFAVTGIPNMVDLPSYINRNINR